MVGAFVLYVQILFSVETNKIYSLFFDSGIIAVESSANIYGRRISYAEYDYTPSTEDAYEVPI